MIEREFEGLRPEQNIPISELDPGVGRFHFDSHEREDLMSGRKDGRKWTEREIEDEEVRISNNINQENNRRAA